jgi:hypothetical protein
MLFEAFSKDKGGVGLRTRRDGHAAVTGWLWLECIAVAPACSVLKGGYILRLDSLNVNVASTEVGASPHNRVPVHRYVRRKPVDQK